MKHCCRERQRRGPVNRTSECGPVCTRCTLAYQADMTSLDLKDNKLIKAFERVQDIRKLIRSLPSEV